MISVAIISVGNELLLGDVLDTNTHWLCRQITRLGGRVVRTAIVPDRLGAIADEIMLACDYDVDLILTTGGLGPTEDDRTLEAVARVVGGKVVMNERAREMVARRYRELAEVGRVDDASLTESREKMAKLPKGGTPLSNTVGTAPGVLLEYGRCKIVSLPGVPPEMKDIFQNALRPTLRQIFGEVVFQERALTISLNDESRLAPILKEVSDRWTDVYIKSRARGFDEGMKILVTFSMSGAQDQVERSVASAVEALRTELEQQGIPAEDVEIEGQG